MAMSLRPITTETASDGAGSPGFTAETGRGFDTAESIAEFQSVLTDNSYDFLDNTYSGDGGYRDGTYLVPHQREGYWMHRRQVSSYKNHFQSVVDAMVSPVFMDTIPRTVSLDGENHNDNLQFSGFLDDCDNRGTSLSQFMQQVATKARIHGCAFIVVDNFPAEAQPAMAIQARESRVYPYVYMRTCQQIAEYQLDDFGRVISITFTAKPEKVIKKIGEAPVSEKRYLRFTNDEIATLKYEKGKWTVIDARTNPISVIPVVGVYFSDRPVDSLFPFPPLYSLARVNLEMYNVGSEMRELQRAQAFAIKYMQSDPSASVSVGANTMLFVPMTATIAPGQISADMGGHSALLEYMTDLRDDFFRIAKQNGVVGVETSVSGIAKEWDFRAEESLLKSTVQACLHAEKQISDLFKLYTNEQFIYNPAYPHSFAPASTMDELKVLGEYMFLDGVPVEGKRQALIKASRIVFRDLDAETVAKVVREISDASDDELYAKQDGTVEPDVTDGDIE